MYDIIYGLCVHPLLIGVGHCEKENKLFVVNR